MRILVPLAGLIDVAAERDRLGKQLEKTRDDLGKVQRKLDNQSFVANAPPEIVAKEHTRIAELTQRATQLEQQLARLAESSDGPRHRLLAASSASAASPCNCGTAAIHGDRTSPTLPPGRFTAVPNANEGGAGTRATGSQMPEIGVVERSAFRRPFAAWLHLH